MKIECEIFKKNSIKYTKARVNKNNKGILIKSFIS